MDLDEQDDILRTLVRIAANQETINQDIRLMLANHDTMLANQALMIERLDATLTAIKDILGRDNGR